jgi:hypothetical protein
MLKNVLVSCAMSSSGMLFVNDNRLKVILKCVSSEWTFCVSNVCRSVSRCQARAKNGQSSFLMFAETEISFFFFYMCINISLN